MSVPPGQCADVALVLENMLKELEEFYPGRYVTVTQNGPNHNRLAVVVGWDCHGALLVRFQETVGRVLAPFFVIAFLNSNIGPSFRLGSASSSSVRHPTTARPMPDLPRRTSAFSCLVLVVRGRDESDVPALSHCNHRPRTL